MTSRARPVRPRIEALFSGGPKTLTDAQGVWHSSIARERRDGPLTVTSQGILGDRVTQPYHGGPNAALCVHLTDHYRFWRETYGVLLAPGSVGENLTLDGVTEETICVGDVIRCGTVLAQVSGPRVPCANQGRHIGRSDWVKLTIRENRTGFYMRVLEPGILKPGDEWIVEQCFDQKASISKINACMYLKFDAAYAERMLHMKGLGEWWREQATEKLSLKERHWTSRFIEEA